MTPARHTGHSLYSAMRLPDRSKEIGAAIGTQWVQYVAIF